MATTEIAAARQRNAANSFSPAPSLGPPDFDSLARIYRWMEYFSFGPMLERCRFHFLRECAGARNALVLGDGDGRFTARLMTANYSVRVEAVDCSAAMLAKLERSARRNAPNAETRLEIHRADLRCFTPGETYDLVVSHFSLDCLTHQEVEGLVERIRPHLTPGATWLISEFTIPEKGWRRAAGHLLVRFLYAAFRWMTHLRVQQIPDYNRILAEHGFQLRQQTRLLGGLLTAETWDRKLDSG